MKWLDLIHIFNLERIRRHLDLIHSSKIQRRKQNALKKHNENLYRENTEKINIITFFWSFLVKGMAFSAKQSASRWSANELLSLLDIIYRVFITKVNKNNKHCEIRHSLASWFRKTYEVK